ncbi:hypothetical protein A1OO_20240 [Enterovibrio norvegicus FF-33]|uniref:hypothetical protein n=1 Tax=Enterovibrio norvegicus TaxID=188144 RepID=UPI0002FF7268|nr:hypothetical protein [Enterovibrio norvegicus]OEE68062.1 hypothetical protein A1OO_20240 [Enterovibrio norvegicus FF-33]
MSKEVKSHDEMRLKQMKTVSERKEVLKDILHDMNCDYYDSFTALTEAVASRYQEITNTLMSGSTIRRKNSAYRALVESYYKTEARVQARYQDREFQLEQELLLTQLDLANAIEELKETRRALQVAHSKMDNVWIEDINSRTEGGVKEEYPSGEVAAYKVLLELVKAFDEYGVSIDGYNISKLDMNFNTKSLVLNEKCPQFFKWYREYKLQIKG